MFSPYIANHNLLVNYITFLRCYKYHFFVIYLSLTAKSRGITFLCPYSTSYKLPWSEAIPGKSRSIMAHTDDLWFGRLRLLMSLMAVLTPMSLHFGL